MAKLAFNKLGLKNNTEIKTVEFNGQNIDVIQYLPIEKKLETISTIINASVDANVFYNPCKLKIFETIVLLIQYTNLNFTDKQLEDVTKLYDLVISTGFFDLIEKNIPEEELKYIRDGELATINEIYKYRNSFAGALNTMSENYDKLQFDTEEIEKVMQDPEQLKFVKDVITKLE